MLSYGETSLHQEEVADVSIASSAIVSLATRFGRRRTKLGATIIKGNIKSPLYLTRIQAPPTRLGNITIHGLPTCASPNLHSKTNYRNPMYFLRDIYSQHLSAPICING